MHVNRLTSCFLSNDSRDERDPASERQARVVRDAELPEAPLI